MRCIAPALLMFATATAQGPLPVVNINGDVWDGNGGPLTAGTVYVIKAQASQPLAISVPAGRTLTIDGAILKFEDSSFLIDGVVHISDSTLTAYADDSAGGDSNSDGFSAGLPGAWNGVEMHNAANVTITDSEVRYAGRSASPGGGTSLWCRGASGQVSLTRTHVLSGNGMGCNFEDFVVHMSDSEVSYCRTVGEAPLVQAANLQNNSATGNLVCDEWIHTYHLPVSQSRWPVALTLASLNTMNGGGTMFLPNVTVEPSKRLTLQGPMVVKALGGTLRANDSQLDANGVVFTASTDDARGGDWDKTFSSVAAPGDWGGFEISGSNPNNNGLFLDICEVHFGGFAGQAAVTVHGLAAFSSSFTSFAHGAGDGMRLDSGGSLGFLGVRNCQFDSFGGIAGRGLSWEDVSSSRRVSATGNAGGDYFEVAAGPVTGIPKLIGPDNYPGTALVLAPGQSVVQNSELRLLPGTVIKGQAGTYPPPELVASNGGKILIDGSADAPIVFTSIRDDTIGGDTNKDGAATLPQPFDIAGITLLGSGASVVRQVWVRYCNNGISCQTASALVGNFRVDHNGGAVYVSAVLGNLLSNVCVTDSLNDGLGVDGPAFDIDHVTIVNAGHYGITKGPNRQHQLFNSIVWGCGFGPQAGWPVQHVHHCNGLYAGQNDNVFLDPMLDPATCEPLPGSPMIGGGDDSLCPVTPRDARGDCRTLPNGDYDGTSTSGSDGGTDLGAVERAPFSMTTTGAAAPGATITVVVNGPGTYLTGVLFGLQDGTFQLQPFGRSLTGVASVMFVGATVGAQPFPITLPPDPGLVGLEFSLQGAGLPGQDIFLGSLTNDHPFVIGD